MARIWCRIIRRRFRRVGARIDNTTVVGTLVCSLAEWRLKIWDGIGGESIIRVRVRFPYIRK